MTKTEKSISFTKYLIVYLTIISIAILIMGKMNKNMELENAKPIPGTNREISLKETQELYIRTGNEIYAAALKRVATNELEYDFDSGVWVPTKAAEKIEEELQQKENRRRKEMQSLNLSK